MKEDQGMKMRQRKEWIHWGMVLVLAGPAYGVQAADEGQTPTNVPPNQAQGSGSVPGSGVASPAFNAPQPQGPASIMPLPEANPGLIGYQPIPESMLPSTIAPAAQATLATPAQGPTPTTLGGPAFSMGPYTLGKDDVVQISVQGQPDFSGTFVIGPDGTIQYGFLGDVPADGLTKDELAQVVAEQLKRFVRVPSVNVMIVGFNSKAVYILGRVSRPGKYAMRGDSVKIRDALIAAGLVVHHAKLRKVHIVKSDPNDPSYRVVDMFKVLYKGKMKHNVDLVNGDIVVVPTTVLGGINDFLSELISPAGHAASAASIAAF